MESSVETSCYQQDHDAPHFCNIFIVSEFGASWSRAVPHRFTVSHGRKSQPTALVWHKNGHCEVALCARPVLPRGHSLWGTISWDPQLLNAGGCCAPSPPSPAPPSGLFGWGCCSPRYGVLSASAVGPIEMLRCVGTLYSPLSTVWEIGSGNYTAK